MTSGDPRNFSWGAAERSRCAEGNGTLIGRRDMSGSDFERDNIVTGKLSASADSKPADRDMRKELHTFRPEAVGLYDPSLEKDSCGVGFIANIKGKKSHQIISDAL